MFNHTNPLLKQASNPRSLKISLMHHAPFAKAFYFSTIFFPWTFSGILLFALFHKKNNNCKKWDLGLRRIIVLLMLIFHTLLSSLMFANRSYYFMKTSRSRYKDSCSSTSVLVIRNTKLLWDRRILPKKGSQVFSLSCHKLNTLTSPDTLQIGCP